MYSTIVKLLSVRLSDTLISCVEILFTVHVILFFHSTSSSGHQVDAGFEREAQDKTAAKLSFTFCHVGLLAVFQILSLGGTFRKIPPHLERVAIYTAL